MGKIFMWQGPWEGGAGYITRTVAEFLHAQGEDVTVGVFELRPDVKLKQQLFSGLEWVPSSFRSLVASVIFQFKYAAQFNVVYAHTLGWWATKRNHTFIHDAADLDTYQPQKNTLSHRFAFWLWRWLYVHVTLRPASRIFSATADFTHYLKRHGIPNNKIITSGSWYDDTLFFSIPRGATPAVVTLLFIGDYEAPHKNFADLKNAFYKRKQFRIVVLGGHKKETDQNIEYRGYVSKSEVAKELQLATLFVLPSAQEGFSVALLEAAATGIPCIASSGAVRNELAEWRNIVIYHSPPQLPEAVQAVMNQYDHVAGRDERVLHWAASRQLLAEYQAMQRVCTTPATSSGPAQT